MSFIELGALFYGSDGALQAALYSLINTGYIHLKEHSVTGMEGHYRTLHLDAKAQQVREFALQEGALEPLEKDILNYMLNLESSMDKTVLRYGRLVSDFSSEQFTHITNFVTERVKSLSLQV